MKRSMIAVCLLLLLPSPVSACFEDHNPGAGWIDRQNSRWSTYGYAAEAMRTDKLMQVSLYAGGSGFVILLGVLVRAMIRLARHAPDAPLQPEEETPLSLAFDGPACEPYCARPEPDFAMGGGTTWEMQELPVETASWAAGVVDSCCCVN